jgi:probable HAF family extracellular repeat protein
MELGAFGGFRSEAFDINDLGQVVGHIINEGWIYHAAYWSEESMIDLGANRTAWGINNHGQVVGREMRRVDTEGAMFPFESFINVAFLWDETNGLREVNELIKDNVISGAIEPTYRNQIIDARHINDKGQILAAARIDGEAYMVLLNPVQNEAPVADAGPAQTVELENFDGTEITLDGSESTDADSSPETNGDIVAFDWYMEAGLVKKDDILLGSGESFVYTFPLGTHTVKLIVTDSAGESAEDEVVITIEDTIPPEVSISASPGTLWPPNGKMKDVLIQGEATDISGEVSLVILVEDEYGEINLSFSEFDKIIQLEAWRKGRDKDGRTYTINVIATDSSGNSAFALTFVIVPHDMGGGNSKK